VKENNDRQMEEKRNYYNQIIQENEKKLAKTKELQDLKMKEKKQQDFARQEDKKDAMERIMKMKEFEKEQILFKINQDNERAKKLQ
jgi:hypothetical protein